MGHLGLSARKTTRKYQEQANYFRNRAGEQEAEIRALRAELARLQGVERQLNDANNKQAGLQQKVAAYQAQNGELVKTEQRLSAQVQDLDAKLAKMTAKTAELENAKAALDTTVKGLQERIAELKSEIETYQAKGEHKDIRFEGLLAESAANEACNKIFQEQLKNLTIVIEQKTEENKVLIYENAGYEAKLELFRSILGQSGFFQQDRLMGNNGAANGLLSLIGLVQPPHNPNADQ